MAKFFLQMNMVVEAETEEEALASVKLQLQDLYRAHSLSDALFGLVRDGDRGNKNLLRPRVEGRFGNHLVGKKISLEELFDTQEEQ
jgi:hypothetical protein